MLRRRRRFIVYTESAHRVQRAYRTYHNRCQFHIHWGQHKAACCIIRNIRRYCARRRLFRAWCARVARFHAAAAIQLWMRATLRRIRAARALRKQQVSSAVILQRFFRYVRFMRAFGARVGRLIGKKIAAAIKLQNAYRAKMARARFYALKDHLEAQRRQEILQAMWHNAYATTIQRWWRKRRRWPPHSIRSWL